jgi:cytochrome c oxidase subunit IV
MATEPPTAVRYHPEGSPDLPEEHSATQHVTLFTYVIVFLALMVLLVLTVGASFWINLGHYNILVALTIAIVKALLVVLFFMHVKYASRLTKIFVAAAFLWLVILFALTFGDYATRSWLPMSRGWVDKDIPAEQPLPERQVAPRNAPPPARPEHEKN